MNVLIASDHSGYKLKSLLQLNISHVKWCDLGCNSEDSVDYPDYAYAVAQKIEEDSNNAMGILICGSGIGMSIAANRFVNVRAALCLNTHMAELARAHNNANILVLGARLISEPEAVAIAKTFLQTSFAGERHCVRVEKLHNIP